SRGAAVCAARRTYLLRYHHATMRVEPRGDWAHFETRRFGRGAHPIEFVADYGPTGEESWSRTGSIEHWLTERYRLYTSDRTGQLLYAEIHHVPWPLQKAGAQIERNTMTTPLGIRLPDNRPLLHFVRRMDAVAWGLEPVQSAAAREGIRHCRSAGREV